MTTRDPRPYDGSIERVDGTRPFNCYLWPTEQWVFNRENPRPFVDFDMRVEIIALADGRFATEGLVSSIEQNRDLWDRPCVFPTRAAAIRASAARMIRKCRATIRSQSWHRVGVTAQNAPAIIHWARALVARETGGLEPRAITIRVPPPPRKFTGLPLFDIEDCRS